MIVTIPARNASAWTGASGNNTYLLTGGEPALIDAGVGHRDHLDEIAATLAGAALRRVLLTHGHPDHASGLPAVLARWPEARVASCDVGRPEVPVRDGERLSAGDRVLTVVATPGHAPDHACFLDEQNGDLYCGDLVRADGSIVVAASKGGDMRAYLASLARVRALDVRRLLPGHGPPILRVAAVIDTFVRHRLERQAQVLAALGAEGQTAAAIAARLYAGLPPGLMPAATDTVLAHLRKLAGDGRAVAIDEAWARA